MEGTASELRLTIEHRSEPIAGSLELPDGRMLRFEGYMQLVSLLEGLRDSPPPESVRDDARDAV